MNDKICDPFYFSSTHEDRTFWHQFRGWGKGGYFNTIAGIRNDMVFHKLLYEIDAKELNFMSVQKFKQKNYFREHRKD